MLMKNNSADLYIPDGLPEEEALARVTHLGIGAHQDDLEFMAFHGILACHQKEAQWFGGVTCTNGAGSARTGEFASHTDEEMQAVRRQEQREAADLGQFAAMIQLDYPSVQIKDANDPNPQADLKDILRATQPDVIYTHNPADKHNSHIGVFAHTLRALRSLREEYTPTQVIGCEVWRGLDWMLDTDKIAMDVSGNEELARKINGLFASQIAGGKRYDLAVLGRRLANATFFDAHTVDGRDQIWYGMDLTPLVQDPSLDVQDYVLNYIDRFREDVRGKLEDMDL